MKTIKHYVGLAFSFVKWLVFALIFAGMVWELGGKYFAEGGSRYGTYWF